MSPTEQSPLHVLIVGAASLWDILPEAQNDPNHIVTEDDDFPIYSSGTGEILKRIPSLGIRRFSRRKLTAMCSEGIDVQYDITLESLTYDGDTVTAHFLDSTTVTGSICLGSDGPSSMVRSYPVGAEAAKATPLEIITSGVHICYNDAAKANYVRSTSPVFSLAVAPSTISNFITIQDVPDPDSPETWAFTLSIMKSSFPDPMIDDAGRLKMLKEDCADLAKPWRSSVLWLPEGTKVSQNRLGYWIPTSWDNRNGRTTLVGDAAHPMPPHRDQGLNHCIVDVSKLVEGLIAVKLGSLTLKEAVDGYEEEMIPHAPQEVMVSKGSAMAILSFDKCMNSPLMKQGLAAGKT